MTEIPLSLDAIRVAYGPRTVLDGVSIDVGAGECVGLVGESGCGKSTLARVAAGLLRPSAGAVRLHGAVLPADPARRDADARRRIQMVFQDPYGSLNPAASVGGAIAEGPHIHRLDRSPARIAALLAEVGLDPALAGRRPHALSGGQRQRVAIARALAVEPDVLILDEPTSALDLSVQAQILNLLLSLQTSRRIAYLFISHDIDVIRHLCHRVAVMHAGTIVEEGSAAQVLGQPAHPYTRRLVAAAPPAPGRRA